RQAPSPPAPHRENHGCEGVVGVEITIVNTSRRQSASPAHRSPMSEGNGLPSVSPFSAGPSDQASFPALDYGAAPLSLVSLQKLCHFCCREQPARCILCRLHPWFSILQLRID